MAGYSFRSYEERQTIQRLWEAPLSSIYAELRRGQDGTRLRDQRLYYDADLAQLRLQQSFERRGCKTANYLNTYGDVEMALMAYNNGPSGARKLWDAGTYQTAYTRTVQHSYCRL